MDNFNPIVVCPHCGFKNRPSISGWGGEISTRLHTCKRCDLEYTVVLVTDAVTDCKVSSMHISAMKSRVSSKLEQIREHEAGLVNRDRELAKELLRIESQVNSRN